jgi:hypothetical protein
MAAAAVDVVVVAADVAAAVDVAAVAAVAAEAVVAAVAAAAGAAAVMGAAAYRGVAAVFVKSMHFSALAEERRCCWRVDDYPVGC